MRRTLAAALMAVAVIAATGASAHAEDAWRHGLSLFGGLKYPADFKHFDYVNADAPKDGTFRQSAAGTFDTLNPFNLKGTAAAGTSLIYDQLMVNALDEPYSEYGQVAEAVRYPDDYSQVTYRLRPEARWHDGEPITPEDVIWSLETLKKAHPQYRFYYQNIERAEQTGPHEVTFYFNQKGNRELPQITGELFVLPKHYWEGTDAKGKKRDFLGSTLEPPLGSGPYRVGKFTPGRNIAYERVDDYWGKDLPVNVGQNNWDEVRYEYFRDTTVLLEAFKADTFDFITENSAKRWKTGYDFPAVKDGRVVLQTFQTKNAEPMQAFVFNIRRDKFADRRVREAFNYAFDFEWLNKNVFYDQYKRTDSYFQNSELQATGKPEGLELQILEGLRGTVPDEVFGPIFQNPTGGNARAERENLRKAQDLLEQAGWTVQNGVLINQKTGEKMEVEFLLVQPDMDRIVNPYFRELERLGIRSTLRVVDVSQYERRLQTFDFDVVIGSFPQSLSPGNEQRDFWGSAAADREGSRNLIGIKNPAVDKLVDRIVLAKDRDELVAATHALDRVLIWNFYVVPQFYSPDTRTARWDRFGLPDVVPDYGISTLTWWWDADKAAAVAAKQ